MSDPFDPGHGEWSDSVEGLQDDGTKVVSVSGSELLAGGED
jgi:hypothetical protein